jgi:RND family efflux transporter MFP subunit
MSNPTLPRRPRSWRRAALIALPLLAAGAGGGTLLIANHPSPAQPAPTLPVVTVATPLARTVAQWDDYIGRFTPSETVAVRARVSGPIVSIHFTDGQMVTKGQLLFTIDPRPFAAALDEARAGVADAVSALALARADYTRASKLVPGGAIPVKEFDASRAREQQAEATLAAAEARMRARALDLEFTEVRVPISGRISDRRIDVGNLAVGGDGNGTTLLTTINALDPIYFVFDISEALYLKNQHQGTTAGAPVEVRLQDEADYRWKGHLDFIDNGIDARSGTLRGRATIANPDLRLIPGLFGNMRLAVGASATAMLIPSTAVQTDQAGKSVLTVGADDVVAVRPVVLGPEVEGLRVVTAGLTPNDRVVIGDTLAAVPGSRVQPAEGAIRPRHDNQFARATSGTPAAQVTFSAD